MPTAAEILASRGKSHHPQGERLGVSQIIANSQYIDVVVARLGSGKLVLDQHLEKTVDGSKITTKIGRRIISPNDQTIVFQ